MVAVSEEIMEPPKTLPPPGLPLTKPELKPGDLVYVMKHSYLYPWKSGMILSVLLHSAPSAPKESKPVRYLISLAPSALVSSIMVRFFLGRVTNIK